MRQVSLPTEKITKARGNFGALSTAGSVYRGFASLPKPKQDLALKDENVAMIFGSTPIELLGDSQAVSVINAAQQHIQKLSQTS